MPRSVLRLVAVVVAALGIAACDRVFTASPAERVGYLRELLRARSVSRDTLLVDACSLNRFMEGIPAWRDSLVAAERAQVGEAPGACPVPLEQPAPIHGRFVLTRWYRNWSGEYVIRGATPTLEQGYRFTDGIFVGRETVRNAEYLRGIADPRTAQMQDSGKNKPARDSSRSAGSLADSGPQAAPDTLRVRDSLLP